MWKLRNHSNIAHDILQYVDDSNNSIGGGTTEELVKYTEDYTKLLKTY